MVLTLCRLALIDYERLILAQVITPATLKTVIIGRSIVGVEY
jgi:hypothetical protein